MPPSRSPPFFLTAIGAFVPGWIFYLPLQRPAQASQSRRTRLIAAFISFPPLSPSSSRVGPGRLRLSFFLFFFPPHDSDARRSGGEDQDAAAVLFLPLFLFFFTRNVSRFASRSTFCFFLLPSLPPSRPDLHGMEEEPRDALRNRSAVPLPVLFPFPPYRNRSFAAPRFSFFFPSSSSLPRSAQGRGLKGPAGAALLFPFPPLFCPAGGRRFTGPFLFPPFFFPLFSFFRPQGV